MPTTGTVGIGGAERAAKADRRFGMMPRLDAVVVEGGVFFTFTTRRRSNLLIKWRELGHPLQSASCCTHRVDADDAVTKSGLLREGLYADRALFLPTTKNGYASLA